MKHPSFFFVLLLAAVSSLVASCQEKAVLVEKPNFNVPIDDQFGGEALDVYAFVDGQPSLLTESEMGERGLEIAYDFGADRYQDHVEIHGFSTRENYEAWSDDRGYSARKMNQFRDLVHSYVEKHKLSEENITAEQLSAYTAFEQDLKYRILGFPEVSPRWIGILYNECGDPNENDWEEGENAIQFANTKPFFSRRAWRNRVSGFVIVTSPLGALYVFDRSWYRRGRGAYFGTIGRSRCIEGTRGSNVANSVAS